MIRTPFSHSYIAELKLRTKSILETFSPASLWVNLLAKDCWLFVPLKRLQTSNSFAFPIPATKLSKTFAGVGQNVIL